jgi:hypothetical protein
VHGDGAVWVNAADRLCRLLGVKMPLTNRRSPASDWHQGDVDERRVLKRDMRPCVPRIPASAGAGKKIAERRPAMRAPRVSPAVVVGSQYMNRYTAKLHEVTRLDLDDLQTTGSDWPEQATRACRGEENGAGRD